MRALGHAVRDLQHSRSVLVYQGVVTTIGRVLPFVTAIKMKSNDQVDFQARIKRSKSLAYYTCTYAVGGAWIRVGGANEAGRASRQGSRNQAVFFK